MVYLDYPQLALLIDCKIHNNTTLFFLDVELNQDKEFNLSNLNKSRKFIEDDFKPLTDMRASKQYRRLVSKNLIERFFIEVKTNKSHTIESI